ncbi:MAG: Mur ligase domain-containing protein, partial [Thiohalobacteraceae bacterium]
MMSMPLAEAAVLLQARYAGPDDRCFTGVSTDTRTLVAENLFFALTGPRFDGHDHLAEAQARGAAGATVSRTVDCTLPLLQVEDTRRALGDLARQWRDRFAIPVVGITG